jgi:tRNA (guanine-N7-)-methyltransferase
LDLVATNEIESALAFLGRWERAEIEIGSGNGHFLAEYGNQQRACGLLGIETKNRRCGKIEKKINTKGLGNVLLFRGKAESLLALLKPASVDAFHIYFPDPWPKTKHRRRRLFKMPALEVFHRALKTGGRIYFGSDVFDYYLQAKVLGALHGGFAVLPEELPPEAVLSMFSFKTQAAGRPLRGLVLQKTGSV